MAKDVELDRLKAKQDLAFQRKQDAHQAMQRAWEVRSSKREPLSRAYDAKQSAYAEQDRTWQDYLRVRSANGPRIEQLNAQQERAYQNMKQAFENASAAHARCDGAGAADYARQGHAYKAESQGYVAQRRRLVAEIRSARDAHEATKPAFQQTKARFESLKREFDAARLEHISKQADFKRLKADFDAASQAFRARLETVKAESKKRNQDRQVLAQRAGVPLQYQDKVWVTFKPDRTTHIYFGGVGKPDGPGHAHYVMDANGKVTYKREPFDPHGALNFTESRREGATLVMARMAMDQWAKSQTTPRQTQHEDSEFKVSVKSGYDHRRGCIVTDVLIFDKKNKREHYHLIIDEYGHELFSEWRENRTT